MLWDNRLGLERICAVIRLTLCVIWAKTEGVISLLFEASTTACLSHPGSRRWRNLYAASLKLSSLLTSYCLCSRCLASLDGSISCFSLFPWHVVPLTIASCKSQLSPHSISDWEHYLSHFPKTDFTRTIITHTKVCSSLLMLAKEEKSSYLSFILCLSLSHSLVPVHSPLPALRWSLMGLAALLSWRLRPLIALVIAMDFCSKWWKICHGLWLSNFLKLAEEEVGWNNKWRVPIIDIKIDVWTPVLPAQQLLFVFELCSPEENRMVEEIYRGEKGQIGWL